MASTPLTFIETLTQDEQTTIMGAAMQSPTLMLFLLKLAAATEVNLSDPRTSEGMTAMVSAGLLTQERVDTIAIILNAPEEPPPPPSLRTVVSTTCVPGITQADGSFWVAEAHKISDGSVISYTVWYAAGSDYEAVANERATNLNAQFLQEHLGG